MIVLTDAKVPTAILQNWTREGMRRDTGGGVTAPVDKKSPSPFREKGKCLMHPTSNNSGGGD